MEKSKANKEPSLITVIFISALFAGFFQATTYFFLFAKGFGHDCGIFAYIGYAITQGKALYVEAWDNKGPLLYLINALGILIDYRFGICLLEFITLFCSFFFLYKTANLFLSRIISIFCAMSCMMSLTSTLEGGNFSEEYALPFTIVGFYLIAKYIKNNYNLKKIEMIIVGMCIAAVFLIRVNILAFLGCAVIGVVIILIRKKEYKKLGTVFGFALAGFIVFLIPFVIYLLKTGALKACIDTAYLQILGSFSERGLVERISYVNTMVLELTKSGTFFIIACFVFFHVLYFRHKQNSDEGFVYLCRISVFGLLFTLLANSVSGASHFHYFISFVPVLIIPTVALAKLVLTFIEIHLVEKYHTDRFKNFAVAFIALAISATCLVNYSCSIYYKIKSYGTLSYSELVTKYIADTTDESDVIQVIGNESACTSYYGAKRLAASNYFYYANGRFSEEAKTHFAGKIYEDIIKTQPKLIMFENVSSGGYDDKQEDFVSHCGHRDEWNSFIEENYISEKPYLNYTIYRHK
ncbi:MAG: hypothetical protein E7386_03300 [Ruminococcaceae bacterium]|nr:hypothetical protein [Oscillospiraceae bacterium]